MREEMIVDLESENNLHVYITSKIKQQNQLLQKENQVYEKTQKRRSKKISIPVVIASLSVITMLVMAPYLYYDLFNTKSVDTNQKTKFIIQNLRGDAIDTWMYWNTIDNTPITINIVNSDTVTQDKLDAIKNAILSDEIISIDGSFLHNGPKGSTSTYYAGWAGALKEISKKTTMHRIPTEFKIFESSNGEGRITINLVKYRDSDGYTGYTKSITDDKEILKSTITIYDVNSLSADQIATITRHEFGHALGLAHSTAPEDLMAPIITTSYPYISECDTDAITALYNGKTSSQVVCEK